MEEVIFLPPIDGCPFTILCVVMNIMAWNCKGASKPSFQNHVRDLVHNHDPAIVVVMETRIGGERAKEISSRLPFDGAILMNTIGFLVVYGFCGIPTEFRSPSWLCRSKKSMYWSRYFLLILILFVLPCMLVLDSMRDVCCGII